MELDAINRKIRILTTNFNKHHPRALVERVNQPIKKRNDKRDP